MLKFIWKLSNELHLYLHSIYLVNEASLISCKCHSRIFSREKEKHGDTCAALLSNFFHLNQSSSQEMLLNGTEPDFISEPCYSSLLYFSQSCFQVYFFHFLKFILFHSHRTRSTQAQHGRWRNKRNVIKVYVWEKPKKYLERENKIAT